MWEKGLYAELNAFRCQVFMDFSVVYDDARGRWWSLTRELLGRGVPSIDAALREMELRPLHGPFAELLGAEDTSGDGAGCALRTVPGRRGCAGARPDRCGSRQQGLSRAPRGAGCRRAGRGRGVPLAVVRHPPALPPALPAARLVSWVEEWMLGRVIREYLVRRGWEAHSADRATALIAMAVRAEEIRTVPDADLPWEALLSSRPRRASSW